MRFARMGQAQFYIIFWVASWRAFCFYVLTAVMRAFGSHGYRTAAGCGMASGLHLPGFYG